MKEFDDLLKQGSRSFYLSLKILPPPLRPAMSVGYMVCRLADTIADTDVFPPAEREEALSAFVELIQTFPSLKDKEDSFKEKMNSFQFNSSTKDGRFFLRYPVTLHAYDQLNKTEKALVCRVLESVAKGMMLDLKAFPPENKKVKALEKKSDWENYLTWIGGEPGRFWTALVTHHFPDMAPKRIDRWMEDGIDFGRGLQMVNILRDMREDWDRGRCYLPEETLKEKNISLKDFSDPPTEKALSLYNELIEKAMEKLQKGFYYLEAIPPSHFRLRAPVWWPMVIGLKTLGRLREKSALTQKKKIKIKRGEVYRMIAASFITLRSAKFTRWEFEDLGSATTEAYDGQWKVEDREDA